MDIEQLPFNRRAASINRSIEGATNVALRAWDAVLGRAGLGGRAALYDDVHYEFIGGPSEVLRKKHYDKSLRLLWKAEPVMPWASFRDASDVEREAHERAIFELADKNMTGDERDARTRINSDEFRALLDRSYTPEQKRAVVAVLAAIGHGEAYAWLVSASLLNEVKSTGARAALTMQIVEEAKHFVVMRELVQAFGVPVPRQSAWEYLMLERTLKAKGLDRFFGMNVLVETIALSIFGLLSTHPGLEVLRLFHLDESRHTALPANYFKEFPMKARDAMSRRRQLSRMSMALPALPLVLYLEPDLAVLGIDAFDFAGSVMRKTFNLAVRSGFLDDRLARRQSEGFNRLLNLYCKATRPGHEFKDFMAADTTQGEKERAIERAIYGAAA